RLVAAPRPAAGRGPQAARSRRRHDGDPGLPGHLDLAAGGAHPAGREPPGRRGHAAEPHPLRAPQPPGCAMTMIDTEPVVAADAGVGALPVSVLTGFLGSGKTTLLRELLRDPNFSETAVVINEFGEIGLDHLLVESAREDMVLLSSGCLCCT